MRVPRGKRYAPPVSGELRGAAIAFVAASAVTLTMAAPVIVAPSQRLFGSAGTFAREDPNRDPLVVIEQMRTGHVPAPYLQPLTDLPGRALARLVGPVTAYNFLVLVTFPLSAAAAYLLARHVVASHAGALVAGLAYAFLPFHVAHAAHHPHVAQTQWIPLYFLALWRCFDRPDRRRVAWLAAAGAAVTLSNFYAGFIAAVIGPVALAAYALVSPRDGGERRWMRFARVAVVILVIPAVLLLLARVLAPDLLARAPAFAFPQSDLFLHAARWWSYLVPAVDHPLAGSGVRRLWKGSAVEGALLEQQVGVGWSLLVLAAVPVWRRVGDDRSALAARAAPVLVVVAAAALLCSLSPERRIGPFTFVRPSALLYEVAPMFRAYARFGVVVGLMVALLAGGGAAWLLARPNSAARRGAILLLALAALELAPFPPWRWRDVLPTRAHRELAAQPGPLRVLDCVPPSRASDALAVPLLGHDIALLAPGAFDDCGEPGLADKLRARGFTHVIVRRDTPAAAVLLAAPSGFARGPQFDDSAILQVTAPPPVAYVDALDGFFPREYGLDSSWRWMGRSGSLTVIATDGVPAAAIDIELEAFPGERRVEWLVNGRSLGAVDVTARWKTYMLSLGTLPRGRSTLMLASATPAVTASDALGNGDPRPLALAVGRWKLTADAGSGRFVLESARGSRRTP